MTERGLTEETSQTMQETQRITINGPAQGAGDACDSILRDLPEWFGIESAIEHYVQACQSLPTLIAQMAEQPVGLLALKQHSSYAAEVYVMAVRPHFHRKGIGKALLIEAEKYLAKCGVEYLQVKTLAPSHSSSHYASTREFYMAMGFRPLEEFPTLWGAENPCLLMVKCLNMTMNSKPLAELIEEAIQILYRELGTVNTVRFLRQFSTNLGDYTTTRAELQDEETLDDLLHQIRQRRDKDESNARS